MTVFDVFTEVTYNYLKINRGVVQGNTIAERIAHSGVFKLKSGMVSCQNQETHESSATLHVHPEDIDTNGEIVGDGIECDGKFYTIVGVTEGKNFDTGAVEHYTLTLERAEYGS